MADAEKVLIDFVKTASKDEVEMLIRKIEKVNHLKKLCQSIEQLLLDN